jgi:hypothetical protein
MRHRRFTHCFRRTAPAARALAALAVCALPRGLHAQAVEQPSQASAPISTYRIPSLALVQPLNGSAVPQDKPVVVFRFAQGESDDQLDLRSLSVAVDGRDVTAGFQIAGNDAWGSLSLRSDRTPITVGVHDVSAQLCSARGACAIARAAVTVLPPLISGAAQSNQNAPEATSLKRRILDAALNATRRLLTL